MKAMKVGMSQADHEMGREGDTPKLPFLHSWTCPGCGTQYDLYSEVGDDTGRRGNIGESNWVAQLHREIALECAGTHPTMQFMTQSSGIDRERRKAPSDRPFVNETRLVNSLRNTS